VTQGDVMQLWVYQPEPKAEKHTRTCTRQLNLAATPSTDMRVSNVDTCARAATHGRTCPTKLCSVIGLQCLQAS
jgi:hypothetical protein